MKIMFLDFDGVISTNRAWLANKKLGIDDFYDRWIDPMAVAMIADICDQFGYRIVVTSTWRKFGHEHCHRALGIAAKYLHFDWSTKDLWTTGSSKGSRPAEITDWLESHNPMEDFIVVDDDGFDWTDEQAARWIKTDQLNGITTENYEAIMNLNANG